MVNKGKQFETDFVASIPDYCYCHRLRDSAQSFNKSTQYSWENECDFFVYDSLHHIFYAIECKSTKAKNISFQKDETEVKKSRMIKYHQAKSLTKMSKFDGIVAGLLLNFRDEKNNMERTYFLDIRNYNNLISNTNKGSINEIDIIQYNAIKLSGNKKRVHYKWDIDGLFTSINDKYFRKVEFI